MKRNWIVITVLVLAIVMSACGGNNGSNAGNAALAPAGEDTAGSAATASDIADSTEDVAAATATAATAQLEAAATATPLADATAGAAGDVDADAAAAAPGAPGAVAAEQQLFGVVRASELVDYDVENAAGEGLGTVEDVIVTLPDGCINYMVLSFGGILGLGDSQYMIPWQAVSFDRDNERLLLNVEQTALESAPTIDLENLPDFNEPAWDAGLLAYWDTVGLMTPEAGEAVPSPTAEVTGTDEMTDTGAAGATEEVTATTVMTGTEGATDGTEAFTGTVEVTGTTDAGAVSATDEVIGTTGMAVATEENPCLTPARAGVTETTEAGGEEGEVAVQLPAAVRLSELLDFGVSSPQGEDLGGLEDLLVDWHQDRLAYAILSVGGFFGLGDKWFVVPMHALTLDPLEQRFIFDATSEQLGQAPGFDPNALPDTADPNWDQEIRNFWSNVPGVDVDVEGSGEGG